MISKRRSLSASADSVRLQELKHRGEAALRDLREIADDMKRHARSLEKTMIYGAPAVTLA